MRTYYRFDPEYVNQDGTKGAVVQIGGDYEPEKRQAKRTSEGELYDGLTATEAVVVEEAKEIQLDGGATLRVGGKVENRTVDIGSRKKRREYMARNGLTDPSDFKEHWVKAAAEKSRRLSGDFDHKRRKEVIGRALEQLSKRGRK